MRAEWSKARRIVVKIGSAQMVLVSSGAIALGRNRLGLPTGPLELQQSQAAAAAGQITLAQIYQDLFATRGLTAAQILLTLGDTEERRRYLNARYTIETLLELKAIPVVNENDTVATSEIRYGDNDRLAARVASMTSADCLVLLSDIDGLYTAPPATNPDAKFVAEVPEITPEIEAMAGDAGTELSRGGMVTKVAAARIATGSGTHMVITSGKRLHPLKALAAGERATWFLAKSDPVTARKRWIAGILQPAGALVLDAGAVSALEAGKSLLPAGVRALEGDFERGDAVELRGPDGRHLGRGLVAYARADADRIIGHRSGEIATLLGYAGRPELVHRDDMALVVGHARERRPPEG
jgi:glutamate 5-kinase